MASSGIKLHNSRIKLVTVGLVCFVVGCVALPVMAGAKPRVKTPFVFIDEQARVALPETAGEVAIHVATITVEGFGPTRTYSQRIDDAIISLRPLCEGIHVVSFGEPVNCEVRFLAINPPSVVDTEKVLKNLPRRGQALLQGEAFTILAMGDSVTHTGDFEDMLAMLFRRATGNEKIKTVDRSYPGRSVDASVRHFDRDTDGINPDLGVLMYGLNDQICFVPRRAYLAQYEWIAKRMEKEFGADMVFLQPTPHISRFGPFAFRTVGFARSVERLGRKLKVPVAHTFDAIWGKGGKNLTRSVIHMWPLYPRNHHRRFSTMLESTGRGDSIHPNALGHLQIARAVFRAVTGQQKHRLLSFSGRSRWTDAGVVSRITATNRSDEQRAGRLEVFAPTAAQIDGPDGVKYELAVGESVSFELAWPEAKTPKDLLEFPRDIYISQEYMPVSVVDFSGDCSSVYSVDASFRVAVDFVPERRIVMDHRAPVTLRTPEGSTTVEVNIPKNRQIGRIPLIREFKDDEEVGYAVAELVYVECGLAPRGNATVDGELGEWEGQGRVPMGEPCQARGWRGPEDHRESPDEAYLKLAFKAGSKGLYIAIEGQGNLIGDNATLFFDPRPPEKLGTVGPYYWAGFQIQPDGVVKIEKGETSTSAPDMRGSWKKTATGLAAEIFVPYALMDAKKWPQSGDLGISIVWRHRHDDGQVTRLTWSEDGHEWNPRWYGIVRRTEQPGAEAPYLVRVK